MYLCLTGIVHTKYNFFMELRVLKYFLAVAEVGNITKAAKYLNLTQPNLSRQINMLEKDIYASNIYTLAYKKNSTANLDFTQKLITL